MNKDWKVFQNDVLDVLKQYQGFFDTFERVGSFRDNSRPDCFARITRENKKEVWILDAKNKETDHEDEKRMDNYVQNLERNPLDVGLELSELSEHKIRGIFITPRKTNSNKYETVAFKKLHPFLQRELVYTDTDKVVRDLAKILERRELPHNHARLLHKSLKPYRRKVEDTYSILEDLESKYNDLELEKGYDSRDKLPVDAIMTHNKRKVKFYFDIPYSRKEAKENNKREQILEDTKNEGWRQVYYASINTFSNLENDYATNISEIDNHIQKKAGILSPEELATIFEPKIPTELEVNDGYITIKAKNQLPFRLEIKSRNDIEHTVAIKTKPKILDNIKTYQQNSMRKLGEVENEKFIHQLEVTEDLEIKYNGSKESLESYRSTVDSIYHSSVSKKLSKKINSLHKN